MQLEQASSPLVQGGSVCEDWAGLARRHRSRRPAGYPGRGALAGAEEREGGRGNMQVLLEVRAGVTSANAPLVKAAHGQRGRTLSGGRVNMRGGAKNLVGGKGEETLRPFTHHNTCHALRIYHEPRPGPGSLRT